MMHALDNEKVRQIGPIYLGANLEDHSVQEIEFFDIWILFESLLLDTYQKLKGVFMSVGYPVDIWISWEKPSAANLSRIIDSNFVYVKFLPFFIVSIKA